MARFHRAGGPTRIELGTRDGTTWPQAVPLSTAMRITRVASPSPDVGCRTTGLFPSGFTRAPDRFLLRRPPEYWAELQRQCHVRWGCNPTSGCDPEATDIDGEPGVTIADRCREETTPIEDPWAGPLSAFDEGELIPELREAAVVAREDSVLALAAAAAASVEDIELARALADLTVTGSAAFARFRAAVPTVEQIAERLGSLRPALIDEARRNAASWARERALEVAAALRTGHGREALGWLAVSAPDDPPHRPVNVPVTAHPQIDLHVEVPAAGAHRARTVRARTMIASGEPPTPAAAPPGVLAPDPTPTIDPEARVLVFVHGHSSRLEESESMLEPLVRRGFTVVAMDLPSCGYSEMVDHTLIAAGGPEPRPSGAPRQFPVLTFMDSFLVAFVDALSGALGRDVTPQICAVIGGSLGGNLSLRLARRNPLQTPVSANVVPWSAASVWTSAAGSPREVGAETAMERAWDDEGAGQRRQYFYDVFDFSARALFVRPQPEYWYRDEGWEPCKTQHIRGARADRQEIYNLTFRRWHWRVAMEQLYFSHRSSGGQRALLGRALLAAGTEDNYEWTNIHDATRELAVEMLNAPGRFASFGDTGHSIHVERPEFLAREIAAFCPPPRPGPERPESWDAAEVLEGGATSDPVAAVQEDGSLLVFALNGSSRVQFRRQGSDGAWSPWSTLSAGLGQGEGLRSNFAVGYNEAGHLEVFATLDSEPWLAHVWQDGPNGIWRSWVKGDHISQLIGGADNAVAVADRVGDGPSRLLLAIARTTGGRIHVRGQNRLDSWWMNGKDLGESSVSLMGRPAAAPDQRRSLHIVVRDSAGALRHIHEESPDEWAATWASFGTVASDAAIALDAGGRLHVFAVGPSGDLRFVRERVRASATRNTRGDWQDWTSLGGAPDASTRPAVIRNAWGQLQVFVRWNDGTVRSRRQLSDDSGTWSDWLEVVGAAVGSPAVAQRGDGTLSLWTRTAAGSIEHRRQSNAYAEPTFERRVTATRKSRGTIVGVCNPAEDWRSRATEDVIRDIETGAHAYFVEVDGARVDIHVVDGPEGPHLRTDRDSIPGNNLDLLPDC